MTQVRRRDAKLAEVYVAIAAPLGTRSARYSRCESSIQERTSLRYFVARMRNLKLIGYTRGESFWTSGT
eukprot:scaffold11504_cov125-Skeletonema_dohrnii-CCMP3373.AAC.2